MEIVLPSYKINRKQKEDILEKIKAELEAFPEIECAYVYGSFTTGQSFKDIDIAIFTKSRQDNPLDYELDLEVKLYRKIGFPIDVRILNSSPTTFNFHVIKGGYLLFSKVEEERLKFESRVFYFYTDFAPFRRRYLEEVLKRKIF